MEVHSNALYLPFDLFSSSIQQCLILRDCLDMSLQFSLQDFSEVVCYCVLPRAEIDQPAKGHPAGFA